MLDRRTFTRLLAATALAGVTAPAIVAPAFAQGAAPGTARGTYVIRNGAVITVDKAGVLPRADILVRDGRIEAVGPDLAATGAETIDATDMIVMPGFVDTHYHMWSAVGRNFVGDGFGYFAAKNATSKLFEPADFYNSVMLGLVELANAGVTTVHNWSHNTRTAAHADAELRAHRESMLRALYSHGQVDQMPRNELIDFASIDRVQRDYFAKGAAFDGLVTYGVNLRGGSQSEEAVYHQEMEIARKRGLWIAIHAGQTPPNRVFAEDYEKRGWLGPKLLICHYLPASDADAQAMARTGTPLSFATHSEFRLGRAGDPRDALLRMRRHNVLISLSFDANSIAPPNMFETMRFTWNMGIPWRGTPTEKLPEVTFREVIEMATLNGAKALGLGDVTGSITVGKRADIILIRGNDINIAPVADIEASVVQSAMPSNVDTVLVDGRIVKRGGRLVAYDVDKVVREAKASALRIRTAAGGRLAPAGR
ncbi:MAG: amidohydrolase family protein [Xanthobacteraceae bacterium]|nr:amidohydrolase family protein [Xanthobacteraceae bacterium]